MAFSRTERLRLLRDKDLLPPLPESPFGPFPPGYGEKKEVTVTRSMNASQMVHPGKAEKATLMKECQVRVRTEPILAGHIGTGGMTFSTFKEAGASSKSFMDGRFGDPKGPGKAGAFKKQKIPPTEFRNHYERGDLPLSIQQAATRSLLWRVDISTLDYHYYLPIFFDGLREVLEPFRFVALQGCYDLLKWGGAKILPTIPQLIVPIKTALNTRHPKVLINVLKVIQRLVQSADYVGEALVPYYRQILPVFNLYKNRNKNLGDRIDYSQMKGENISDLVNETLALLERYGGEDAYINIKYMVPTYESSVA